VPGEVASFAGFVPGARNPILVSQTERTWLFGSRIRNGWPRRSGGFSGVAFVCGSVLFASAGVVCRRLAGRRRIGVRSAASAAHGVWVSSKGRVQIRGAGVSRWLTTRCTRRRSRGMLVGSTLRWRGAAGERDRYTDRRTSIWWCSRTNVGGQLSAGARSDSCEGGIELLRAVGVIRAKPEFSRSGRDGAGVG